jgi:mannose-6-phosphate isomerase-like protein (cupin superfamily)
MNDPMIIFSNRAPVEIHGADGGSGSLLWKRLAGGVDMVGDWESFEYARLQPGGSIGEHVHNRTEEIYYITEGRALMHMDETVKEIGPGDLVLTPIDGRHSAELLGDEGLEFIVAEVIPADILYPDRPHPQGWQRVRAADTPIVHLEDRQPLDPSPYFNGPWKAIERRVLGEGERFELAADAMEHAFYVVNGNGRAVSRSREVELGPGEGIALPEGGQVVVQASDDGLELILVTVDL